MHIHKCQHTHRHPPAHTHRTKPRTDLIQCLWNPALRALSQSPDLTLTGTIFDKSHYAACCGYTCLKYILKSNFSNPHSTHSFPNGITPHWSHNHFTDGQSNYIDNEFYKRRAGRVVKSILIQWGKLWRAPWERKSLHGAAAISHSGDKWGGTKVKQWLASKQNSICNFCCGMKTTLRRH